MDKPISAGDLVVVVRSMCGNEGKIGTAEKFAGYPATYDESSGPRWWVRFDRPAVDTWGEFNNPAAFPEAWLKRIPPIEELDDVKRDEEITA